MPTVTTETSMQTQTQVPERRTNDQMIREMYSFYQRCKCAPTISDVDAEAAQGNMATARTYLRRLGMEGKSCGRSWKTVLAACGIDTEPWNPDTLAQRLALGERARQYAAEREARWEARQRASERNRLAKAESHQCSETSGIGEVRWEAAAKQAAEQKRQARIQRQQKSLERRAVAEAVCAPYEPITVPTPFDNGIAGRTEMASTLKLINLTGYTLILEHKGRTNLRSSGTIEFFADQYKFMYDQVTSQEVSRLFGGIETKRVDAFYCIYHRGKQYSLPAPQPGTYYLMPRRAAELIGSTGRTMNDLIFPLQYELREDSIIVKSVAMKESKPAKPVISEL